MFQVTPVKSSVDLIYPQLAQLFTDRFSTASVICVNLRNLRIDHLRIKILRKSADRSSADYSLIRSLGQEEGGVHPDTIEPNRKMQVWAR